MTIKKNKKMSSMERIFLAYGSSTHCPSQFQLSSKEIIMKGHQRNEATGTGNTVFITIRPPVRASKEDIYIVDEWRMSKHIRSRAVNYVSDMRFSRYTCLYIQR